ncbi:hypothetical protein XENTR_v10022170 [Xenopus tropicalis]|uniref:Taste receptor type 2 n=1 Tax=Xenopus tropicalis TaxID=8364 RepID=Q2AB77_XENTR|nr:bitter taste receptor 4 [Xenopus tropicalis]KAE8587900.1 hypothetical protein XENTR_v10022170 [Xenopus tropicalis]BAE80390.1 bitter taste receptor [Xenopus tropicalis]|eukprot:NP_001165467.1 bitter taste receptor 4 [Xenopus tropicalis]
MLTIMDIVTLSIDLFSVVVSSPGHLFVMLVNLQDLINNVKFQLNDQLIFCISLFSFVHGIVKICSDFLLCLAMGYITVDGKRYISVLLSTISFCILWYCTWLSLYFCLKIVNFKQGFYVYLQKNFHRMFPWIHIISTMGSFLASLPVGWDVTEYSLNSTSCAANQNMFLLMSNGKSLKVIMVVSFVAFLLFFSSSLSIIISLYRHIRRMKTNMQSFSDTSCDVHVRVTETVAALFAANALYYLTLLLCAFLQNSYIWQCVIAIILSLTRAPRPIILVRANKKLEVHLRQWLHCCACITSSSDNFE